MLSEVMCSFCLRSRSDSGRLVASPLAAICRECAHSAVNLFRSEDSRDEKTGDVAGPPTPWARLNDDALLARLPEVAAAGRQVEDHLGVWVSAARDRGISWAKIGAALGMTRQSAWERFTPSM